MKHLDFPKANKNENSTRLTDDDLSMISDALIARIDAASDAARLTSGDTACYDAIKDFQHRLYILNNKICGMMGGKT